MLANKLFERLIKVGDLTIIDAKGRRRHYKASDSPKVTIRITDPHMHWKVMLAPQLAVGEAYMDGKLVIEEGTLFDFIDIGVQNLRLAYDDGVLRWLSRIRNVVARFADYNPIPRAKQRVAHHYDLDGRLFSLFLDSDQQYSCAYFADPSDDLETAQRRKKLHLAAKLSLQPGQKVLDIGSGWGGLGLTLAEAANVSVTGITLSEEQHKVSNERAQNQDVADRVGFHLRDYRNETGCYDRIVSVGMLEHVGRHHYRAFFSKVKELLAEDGVAVIHSIGRFDQPGPVNAWMRKYIFPGSYIPTLSEITGPIEECNLLITDIEILRLHYAETLLAWRRNFHRNLDKVREIYDERFCRMWDFYLTACELGFRRKELMVFQIQLAKSMEALPITRDYIHEFEAAHDAGWQTRQRMRVS
ncbi:SAM-dependent methyltransferase [Oceanibaculum nanhaiense]|uniref:SAM-dependent methyltransferase n=1 Tax=Oceanibaculum nanhaiense TaxID=1909734 RepID=UPI000A36CE2F|nr:cyclopropane-fatty-acyl-phospholipid synthase family protein [Oceanibaculum nanhaiense]